MSSPSSSVVITEDGDLGDAADDADSADFVANESFDSSEEEGSESSVLTAGSTGESGTALPAEQNQAKRFILEPDPTTGALVYRYSLTVPPGRNGLTPDLALTYNSQDASRAGYLGDRWSVNIPYIERLNKNGTDKLYADNYFTSNLSGELAQISTSTYGPKVESGDFLKFDFDASAGWTVTDKAGTVYKFGSLATSRQDDPNDSARIYRWMLSEARDTNGNFISYSYYKSEGQIYPDTITYTGNGATPGIFKVAFVRGSYDSLSPSLYYPDFKVKTCYRVTGITTSMNDEWVRKYELGYTAGDGGYRPLLSSITESGRDLDTGAVTVLPAAAFGYKAHGAMGWENQGSAWQLPEWFLNRTEATMVQIADVNGDTFPDVVYADQGTNINPERVYINNASNGWNANDANWTFPTWIKNVTGYKDNGTRIFDVNGDLLNDVVRSFSGRSGDPASASSVYLNSGDPATGWVATNSIAVPIGFVFGSSLYADDAVRVVDVNGDGLGDLVRAYLDDDGAGLKQSVYLATGSGWGMAPSGAWQVPFPIIDENPWGSEVYTFVQFADVNGDNLPDILWRYSQNQYWWPSNNVSATYAFINNGHGWEPNDPELRRPPMAFEGHQYISNGRTDLGVRSTDLTGDGIPDILYAKMNNAVPNSYAYLNSGKETAFPYSQFNPNYVYAPEALATSNGNTESRVQLADVNADGLDDFLYSERRRTDGVSVKVTHLAKPNSFTDLLVSAVTPNGGTYAIAYKLSNQYKNPDGALMNPALPLALPTVEKITATDPVMGVAATSTYSYRDGFYYYASPADRRFAGFGMIAKTDPAGNVTKTYYHQGNSTNTALGEYADHASKIGKFYRMERYDAAGKLYAATVNRWDGTNLGTGRDFVKLVSTTALTYDGNGTHKDAAQEFSYDGYGNLTQKIIWGEVTANSDGSFTDIGSDRSTESISYTANILNYVVGLPYHNVVLDQSSNKVRETKIYYDALGLGLVNAGNPTKTEEWVGGTAYVASQRGYNTYGMMTSETDPRGKITSYGYDAYNLYVATKTDPLSHVTEYLYDYSLGKPKQITDNNDFIYHTTYDGLDRVTAEKIPGGTTPYTPVMKTSYAYTDTSGAVKVQRTDYLDGSTAAETYQYFDSFGRVIQERKEAEAAGAFNVKDVVYNSLGLKEKESLPYVSSGASKTAATAVASLYSSYSYDPLGRPLAVTNAVGTTTYTYEDWKTTVVDANGKVKHYYKDAIGNLSRVDEVNGGSTYTTSYAWSPAGKLSKITDALGNVRNFTYDGLGRRLTAQDLHAPGDTYYGAWAYSYDDAGNMVQTVSPNGQTTNYTYNDTNQVLTEDYTGIAGVEIAYTYGGCANGVGKLCFVAMTSGANTAYAYDPIGAILSETRTINGTTYRTSYSYDRQSNILVLTYPDNAQVRYAFNAAGLLERVERKESGGVFEDVVSNFDYGPAYQVTIQAFANGVTTTNTYDAAKLYRLTRRLTQNTSGLKLQDLNYTHDAVGNIVQLIDASSTIGAKTVSYTYDDLNRLISAVATGSASDSDYTQSFTYDALGNITSGPAGTYLYQGNAGTLSANPHAATSVGGVTYTYDRDGNLTDDGTFAYAWNYRDQLVQTVNGPTAVNYYYDHNGSRVLYIVNGATYRAYPGQHYNTSADKKTKQIFAGSELVATVETLSEVTAPYYVHADQLSSTNSVSGSSGTLMQVLDYYPFGAQRLSSGIYSVQRQYIGREYDEEAGLNYLNARYCSGQRGQFISQDPVFWEIEQSEDGKRVLLDPQSQNSYSYGRSNPVANKDPEGRYWETAFDAAMFLWSLSDYKENPSFLNGVSVVADGASLVLPIPAIVGGIKHADYSVRAIRVAQDVGRQSKWRDPYSLIDHAFRHARDFGLRRGDVAGYAQASTDFISTAESAIKQGSGRYESFVDGEGKTYVFDRATKTYGVKNADGTTATAYKPYGGDPVKAARYWEAKKFTKAKR